MKKIIALGLAIVIAGLGLIPVAYFVYSRVLRNDEPRHDTWLGILGRRGPLWRRGTGGRGHGS